MARLWEYVDGEPFFINGDEKRVRRNPALAILGNPKKKGRKMAKRRVTRKRGRKNSPKRRSVKRYRRNAWPMAGAVTAGLGNPHRRKRRGRKMRSNPARRRRYHRNPMLGSFLGLKLPPLQTVAYVGAGFVAAPILEEWVMTNMSTYLPASLMTNPGKYIVKIGAVAAVSAAGSAFLGSEKGTMLAIGGGVYLLVSILKDFVGASLPATSLMAYNQNLQAYKANLGLRSYHEPTGPTYTPIGLGAAPYGPNRTTGSAPAGGQYLVAMRNRRFS